MPRTTTPGDRLKTARQRSGLTQQGVADELSQTVSTYKRWEQDRAYPRTYAMIGKLCRVLHISIDHYLQGSENPQLPADEAELLEKFRRLSPQMQTAIRTIIDENQKAD